LFITLPPATHLAANDFGVAHRLHCGEALKLFNDEFDRTSNHNKHSVLIAA
jgi:hypothetical protein